MKPIDSIVSANQSTKCSRWPDRSHWILTELKEFCTYEERAFTNSAIFASLAFVWSRTLSGLDWLTDCLEHIGQGEEEAHYLSDATRLSVSGSGAAAWSKNGGTYIRSLNHYTFSWKPSTIMIQSGAVTVTPPEIWISQEPWQESQNGFGSP